MHNDRLAPCSCACSPTTGALLMTGNSAHWHLPAQHADQCPASGSVILLILGCRVWRMRPAGLVYYKGRSRGPLSHAGNPTAGDWGLVHSANDTLATAPHQNTCSFEGSSPSCDTNLALCQCRVTMHPRSAYRLKAQDESSHDCCF